KLPLEHRVLQQSATCVSGPRHGLADRGHPAGDRSLRRGHALEEVRKARQSRRLHRLAEALVARFHAEDLVNELAPSGGEFPHLLRELVHTAGCAGGCLLHPLQRPSNVACGVLGSTSGVVLRVRETLLCPGNLPCCGLLVSCSLSLCSPELLYRLSSAARGLLLHSAEVGLSIRRIGRRVASLALREAVGVEPLSSLVVGDTKILDVARSEE